MYTKVSLLLQEDHIIKKTHSAAAQHTITHCEC